MDFEFMNENVIFTGDVSVGYTREIHTMRKSSVGDFICT